MVTRVTAPACINVSWYDLCLHYCRRRFAQFRMKGRVLVLERTKEAGKKVLMSGGSRCNVLPTEVDLDKVCHTIPAIISAPSNISTQAARACNHGL